MSKHFFIRQPTLTFFLQYMEYNTLEVSDMEIYADVIFFVNFIFSYVLLYILGKFVNTVKIKKLRLAVAAVIGGISWRLYLYRNADVDSCMC